ncbi:CCA tRNA nucleotidyltransferase [Acidimangrovimonas sediminis]|uniref:CCA tRNA nucleotidyltransferase n=1 Tax=Acidimangrovimonas sediminis TaxID=2056283 RepID=UPI000C80C3E1|nr:CCA tRNA nucleotidyltransferase [Acidimangrovimonas sediminis]
MRVDGAWRRRAGTQAVCAALTVAGYRALFVGGCVRNALLGAEVADVDIATDALPETVTELAEKAGLKVVPTGIDHGTVTVVSGGIPHEVTTFRHDIDTDGRHATVSYTTDPAEDAARRDFTMNALYATPEGEVIDPLGGLDDLRARRVRFVGCAEERIREDYLRILRFFRFHAWYGDPSEGLDPEGLAACAENLDGLARLSKERIGAEMRKLLSAPDPATAVGPMHVIGVLSAILPGADPLALGPLLHLEGDRPPRFLRRLAVLGGREEADALRLSRVESRDLGRVRDEIGGTAGAGELGYRLGATLAEDVILCRAALLESPLPGGWRSDIARGAAAVLPVRAADLPDLQGPEIGAALRRIEARWIASGFTLDRDALLGDG